jgi:D-alanyl-D-alanine carboxypeptidase
MATVLGAGWLLFGASAWTPSATGAKPAAPAGAAAGVSTRVVPPPVERPIALTGPDRVHVSFGKNPPASGLLFDMDSGQVLWRNEATTVRPIASTTKIMSALIVADRTRPRQTVQISKEMRDYSGSAVGLPHGKKIPVESLFAAMLVQSGNDAALALAIASDGSVPKFVQEMNDRARDLGLACTHYTSPHGLQPSNRSCAADLAVLARLAMQEPRIRRIVREDGAQVPWPIKGGILNLAPTNPLLISDYPGTVGLKTGYTDAAGRCLVGVVARGEREYGVVLLDSPDPAAQAEKLFDAAFRKQR